MSVWGITANAEVSLVNGLPSGVDNDAGSVRYGGNIASVRWQATSLGEGNEFIDIVNGVNGITGVNDSAVFNGGDQVIVLVTNDLGGLGFSGLLGGASNSANKASSINAIEQIDTKLYKTAIRNGAWNVYSGVFSPAVSVVNSGGWSISDNADVSVDLATSGVDNAASPTQDVPGELVYHYGSGADPVTDEYEARTQW